jgi:RNA 2',3'-cyclic 3'-phosphodiesterase
VASDNMIRAFLALDPPPEVLQRIIGLQETLKKMIPHGVRWVNPDGIHLTLKFLGNIFPSSRENIESLLPDLVGAHPSFTLSAGRIGVFPGLAKPRVIWVGIGGETRSLFALQKDIEEALESIGFPKEDRPFRAHLTLGRVNDPRALQGMEAAIAQGQSFDAGSFPAEKVLFIKSDLTPAGAIYNNLAAFSLARQA